MIFVVVGHLFFLEEILLILGDNEVFMFTLDEMKFRDFFHFLFIFF